MGKKKNLVGVKEIQADTRMTIEGSNREITDDSYIDIHFDIESH